MRTRSPKPRPIAPPDLPSVLATPLFAPGPLRSEAQYAELHVVDWDVSDQSAEHVLLDALSLERATFARTVLKRPRVRDARLTASDLSNAAWSHADFCRVEILAGRLTGFKAVEAGFTDVRFVGCKAEMAQFRHATFRDAAFEDCVLREADFQGADLQGVRFRGSDLQGANFTGAKLAQADFRGVRLDQVSLRPEDLRGMIIDSAQALELAAFFAASLGVVVAEG